MDKNQENHGHDKSTQQQGEALSYSWELYRLALDWYKTADSKGQLLITINGIFITIFSSLLVIDPAKLVDRKIDLPLISWCLITGAAISISMSVICAVICLASRLSDSNIKKQIYTFMNSAGSMDKYHPAVIFWFGTLATIDSDVGGQALRRADNAFALEALSKQVFLLSKNVLKKHRWVNRGWVAAGTGLLLSVTSVASVVIFTK